MINVEFFLQYQAKSITPVDEYVCTLSEELQKQAQEELGETPEIRDRSLKEFRDWILNNPRIEKCRMDSKFILRFLRQHKYSMKHAKESFERYLLFRQADYGYDWFSNLDTERPNVQEMYDKGLFVVLPSRSASGEKVIMTRLRSKFFLLQL